MTKREIIEELLARRGRFTHRESETIVNAMFDAMANSLMRGERIEIRGFGSFAVKQLTADPWNTVAERYPLNTRIHGKVSSVADFGVFVEIEEGIEGLIHISQLSNERVDKPSSLYKVDDELDALVVQLDPKERRIGLSIKAVKQHEEREEMQAYLKREHEAARFSMEDILKEELKLDRDDGERRAARGGKTS